MAEPLRLFLIEEDDDIALLIRKGLERAGYQVTRCRTATDALIVLGHNTFDLVLLDQRLPDMPGLELLHALAREGIVVPTLMVTGCGDEQLATQVLQAGALDYVVKDPRLTFLAELPKRVSESMTRHRLLQTNRLLVQALESARDGIMITDSQGTIQEVNHALEAMTGYSRQELVGQTPRLLKSNVHPPEVYTEMWRTILFRASWQGELTNRRKDGTLFQASLTVSPIVDAQGRLTHFVGIQRDVTGHKQLERQLLQAQKMQSVGTLAGGVAHEFNNLLAGINGYAALGLREAGLSPPLREYLQHIVELSERAAVLTRQLLTFARKPALVRRRTDMADLVRDTADLVRRTLHVEVHLDMAHPQDGMCLLVEADANQLQQALVNLALNARDALLERAARTHRTGPDVRYAIAAPPVSDFPPEGEGATTALYLSSISFRLEQTTVGEQRPAFPQAVPPGDYVVFRVEDKGVGMTSEVLTQALDPFFTTKDVGQGTGLGLPMVFGIVQGHQGYLTLDSTPMQGTCVSIYLSRVLDSQLSPEVPPASELTKTEEKAGEVGRSILVIDDEVAVLDVMRQFLQIAGHSVTCATSGHEALDSLANGRTVDLVILDLMMPREDAASTMQRLRQRRPGVPVLLCTGLPHAEPAPELLRKEGVGLIRKPFRMQELWNAVRTALERVGAT
jgi:PAS domain S-box-containing protein